VRSSQANAVHFEETLDALDRTVAEAAGFFTHADESLADGCQTARDVISHLVFWHREYVASARAMAAGRPPKLRRGVSREMNAQATHEFAHESLPSLAQHLAALQRKLDKALRRLPDLNADFPIKEGGRYWSVEDRVPVIESHIRNHVKRLKQAVGKEIQHEQKTTVISV
jgi:hypothetical protein